jgi:choline kinase
MLAFLGSGPKLFVEGLERAVRREDAMRRWYLSVVHELAEDEAVVGTASIRGLWWREIDGNQDLTRARAEWGSRAAALGRTGTDS